MAKLPFYPRNVGNLIRWKWHDIHGIVRAWGFDAIIRQESVMDQPLLDAAPVELLSIDVKPVDGEPYTFRLPAEALSETEAFNAAFKRGLGSKLASTLKNEDGEFQRMLIARSLAPEFFPLRENDFWQDDSGAYYQGRMIADKAVDIVDERVDKVLGTVYTVRAAGRYADVTFDELMSATYGYALDTRVLDPICLFAELRRIWSERTEHERKQFKVERLKTEEAAIKQRIAALKGDAR